MSGQWLGLGLAGAVSCLLSPSATGANLTLGATADNTLYQDANGALSNGAGEFFFAGRTAAGLIRRGLVRFDLGGGLPVGAVINSVSLTLHLSMTSAGISDVSLHSSLDNWGEGASDATGGEGGGAPSATGDATWIHTQFNTALWATAGGDFLSGASAMTTVSGVGFYTWSSAQMIVDVQGWLEKPPANFGWLLQGNESVVNTTKRFDTKENANAEFRPMLTIEYTVVPQPGALTLILSGLLAAKGRRRH